MCECTGQVRMCRPSVDACARRGHPCLAYASTLGLHIHTWPTHPHTSPDIFPNTVYMVQNLIAIVIVNSIFLSAAPTKAKSREPAYSQSPIKTKIDRQRVRSRESGRYMYRRSDGYGGWCLELRRGGRE